jgi:membrane protein DedA with SNARE-associated domain
MNAPVFAGYLGLFTWIFLAEAGVPLLVPTELWLVAGGVAAAHGLVSIAAVGFTALCADLLGTVTLFVLVRTAGRRDRHRPGGRIARAIDWATSRAHAVQATNPARIAVARCIPLLRMPAAVAAALAQVTVVQYGLAALAGGLLWVGVFAGGAYLLTSRAFGLA